MKIAKKIVKICPNCGAGMFVVPCPDGSRALRCSNWRCKNNRVAK